MADWKEAFERGMAAGGAGDLVAAERAFRDAVALAPDEPYPHYELGYTLSLAGRFTDALAALRTTASLLRRLAGEPAEARAIWEQIERDFPDHPYAQVARLNASSSA